MDAKFDAYEGFDPTQTEGGGCSCEGGVYWDMITQTWKQGKVATTKAGADCSQVEAALKQAQAQADKTKEDLNEALAELVTKQNKIAELKRKLEECQKDKCPEVDVVSLGDETVFSGNSCDRVYGLSKPKNATPDDHL